MGFARTQPTLRLPRDRQKRLAAKKSRAKSTFPSGVRGRFARSRVDTRNNAPAPSASEAVMIGVLTQKNRSRRRTACAKLCRAPAELRRSRWYAAADAPPPVPSIYALVTARSNFRFGSLPAFPVQSSHRPAPGGYDS